MFFFSMNWKLNLSWKFVGMAKNTTKYGVMHKINWKIFINIFRYSRICPTVRNTKLTVSYSMIFEGEHFVRTIGLVYTIWTNFTLKHLKKSGTSFFHISYYLAKRKDIKWYVYYIDLESLDSLNKYKPYN